MALDFREGHPPVFHLTHTAAVTAYDPVVIGSMLVIPQTDAAIGVEFAAIIPGVQAKFENADAGATIAVGALVYWDVGDSNFNVTAASNTLAGYALTAGVNNGTFTLLATGPR